MPTCPKCTKPISEESFVCPFCGVMVSFYRGPEVGEKARKRIPGVRGGSGFPVFKLTAVLFVVGLVGWWLLPEKLPAVPLQPSAVSRGAKDPCIGKERCVLVYVAPWCSACKRSIGVIRSLVHRFSGSDQVGVKTIVGGRSKKNMETMAAKIGRGTYLDPEDLFMHAAGARSIPHWFVLDEEGFVIKAFPGASNSIQVMIDELGLSEYSQGG